MADRNVIAELTVREAAALRVAGLVALGACARMVAPDLEDGRDVDNGRLEELRDLAGAVMALERAQADADRIRAASESHPRGSTSRAQP